MVAKIPKQEQDILLWLVNLLLPVVENERINCMSAKNVGIVVGPNLIDNSKCDPNSPAEMVMIAAKGAQFLEHLLNDKIMNTKGRPAS